MEIDREMKYNEKIKEFTKSIIQSIVIFAIDLYIFDSNHFKMEKLEN